MPGTTSTALFSFSHDQHHETDAAKRKGGGNSLSLCDDKMITAMKRLQFRSVFLWRMQYCAWFIAVLYGGA